MGDLITIGKITRTHGIRGQVIIRNESRWYEPFKNITTIWLFQETGDFEVEIEEIIDFKDRIAIKFKGVQNPEDAQRMVGAEVKIDKEKLPILTNDEFYVFEISGFDVYSSEGQLLGKVNDVINAPANDIIVVETRDKTEMLIPAAKAVIDEINRAEKRIVLNTIEGFEE
jgi:16S rRNA processing protein RimM